jgi:DNA-binding CsgD family transcriptional regulator
VALVERDQELAALERLLADARSGTGSVLLLEGSAGIGKTSLLAAAREPAAESGMRVLQGRGTELEREYPLGVARQCLEPAVRPEADRERLLRGAARLAGPVLLDVPEALEATPVGILHGLYWLVANLAEEAPVLLVVDDAHWADEPSLRFLAYVARRVESLPVALLVATRPAEEGALAAIGDDPATTRIEPPALGLEGVGRLLREHGTVDDAFARACHDATGGNPFLLGELVRALRADGVPFTAAAAERVTEVTPPTVSRAVGATLARLGAEATALARAAAILGEGTALDPAAELAGLPVERAAAAASDLVRSGLLDDATPMRFRHPVLTAAVRAGVSSYDRAAAHARAADLLRARGAAPERVALQVLHAPPGGDAGVVSELRLAADRASERGAPATAAALLARALAEPPDSALLAEVLFELGRAELATAAPDAPDHLAEAHRSADDPAIRGRALALLAQAIPVRREARARLVELVADALPDVQQRDREIALRLRAVLALEGDMDSTAEPAGDTLGEAVFLGHLVFSRMRPGASAAEIADLATRAARQVDGLLGDGAASLAFTGMILALRWTDRLEEAERLLNRAIAAARRRGSTIDFATAMTLRAAVRRRGGRLRDAEADARGALAAALGPEWSFARGVAPLVGALLDQGRVEEAAGELRAVVAVEAIPDSPPMIPVLLSRMSVRAAEGEHAGALADWDEAVRRSERLGRGVNAGWIEDLVVVAGVHQARGDRSAAEAVAAQAVELAKRWDTPGAIGQALHTQALVGSPDASLDMLQSAVVLLEQGPARLEHARACITLGGALRRRGHRVESRTVLREGYELARYCGADALAETARSELRASGIRLQREPVSGADSLTPSERRIADMAAAGLSNAEIAQELFLTVKTIEMHLTRAYRKLDVRRRAQLAQALGAKS